MNSFSSAFLFLPLLRYSAGRPLSPLDRELCRERSKARRIRFRASEAKNKAGVYTGTHRRGGGGGGGGRKDRGVKKRESGQRRREEGDNEVRDTP